MIADLAVVGAGFAGAVLARQLAASGRFRLHVFDARSHVAGNAHTERDPNTQVMIHRYGPHIFHTPREDVWNYINQFGSFGAYTNRVKAVTARGVYSLPINLLTINQFFGLRLTPAEARAFLAEKGERGIDQPQNLEEQALKFIGRGLYENFFYGYTRKQWGTEPRLLPASILQRLPVRFDYNDNYYDSRFQGIPLDGYTAIVQRILQHPAIHVYLSQKFKRSDCAAFDHVFYSGSLDGFFDYELGRLPYRTLRFEAFEEEGDFQGNAVMNYCEPSVPFTRISEHKHFAPWEQHARTVCYREYSAAAAEEDTPYYPLRLERDKALLSRYQSLAGDQEAVTFIGRLGSYRYLDMHVVIAESLDLAQACLAQPDAAQWPRFTPVGAR